MEEIFVTTRHNLSYCRQKSLNWTEVDKEASRHERGQIIAQGKLAAKSTLHTTIVLILLHLVQDFYLMCLVIIQCSTLIRVAPLMVKIWNVTFVRSMDMPSGRAACEKSEEMTATVLGMQTKGGRATKSSCNSYRYLRLELSLRSTPTTQTQARWIHKLYFSNPQ